MNNHEFAEMVRQRGTAGSPISERSLREAIFNCQTEGKCSTPGDVQACLALAREMDVQKEGSGRGDSAIDVPSELSPKAAFDELEDEVAELRKEIFGSPELFEKWTDVCTWLQQESESSVYRSPSDEELLPLKDSAFDVCRKLSELLEIDVSPVPVAPMITYEQCDCGSSRCRIIYSNVHCGGASCFRRFAVRRSDQRLFKIKCFTSSAMNRTGLTETAVLVLLFCGKRQEPRTSVQWTPLRFPAKILYTVITIPHQWPTWKDLAGAYKYIQANRWRGMNLDKVGALLVEVINEHGGVPSKGKMEFWEKVARDVQKKAALEDFTGQAARKRYLRFPEEFQESLRDKKL